MKLIGCPAINGLGKTDGCEEAPKEIVRRLKEEIFLSESMRAINHSLELLNLDKSNISHSNELIEQHISNLSDVPIVIGGDHSITYASFKAFSKRFKNAGLVVFDAHPDTVNNFNPPTHEDYLRTLIEEGHVKAENVVLVGTRAVDETEASFLRGSRIHNYPMKSISGEGLHEICDSVMSIAREFGAVYISIDIDAIDPAFAPGTGYIEPGGLTSREFLYFLSRMKNLKNIQAYDLVEVNPKKDINGMTVKLAARIIAEILG